MRLIFVVISILIAIAVFQSGFCAGKSSPTVLTIQPTKACVLVLADTYIKEVTPQMTLEEESAVDKIKFTLDSKKNVKTFFNQSIDELVNSCTVQLATNQGIEAVIVTSALLVKYAPDNPRTANLFGVVLHSIGKDKEAIAVLEYTHKLNPVSELVMLNAANVYLDLNQDEKCKALADKVLSRNSKNKAAYSLLATYWFKQGDLKKTLDAMTKAASFGGYKVQKKAEKNDETVRENTVTQTDEIETIEEKLAKTNSLTPNTTADLIEDQFPNQAQQIRDKYCKLIDDERIIMPPLPQVNTSGVQNWKLKGEPYIKSWQKAFRDNATNSMMEVAHLQANVNKGDSRKTIKAKGKAAENVKIQQSIPDAQKLMAMMENMPGIPKAKIAAAKKKLQESLKKQNIMTPPAVSYGDDSQSSDEDDSPIKSDDDLAKYESADLPPGWDSGSVFATCNYRNYLLIKNNYQAYFNKYLQDINGKVDDILKVYNNKVDEEDQKHNDEMDKIKEEQKKAQAARASGAKVDMSKYETDRRQETLRYKRAINALGDDYFAQWANLVLPQYHKKMKPALDNLWSVCALYVRNMNDPEVLKNEYCDLKRMFWTNAGMAVGSMNVADFKYYPETNEQQRQYDADLLSDREDAQAREEEYKNQTKMAESAFEKWIEDTFALSISGEFLSMKITPRKLTVEEYIAGMNFKHVLDFKTGNWTTYRSFSAKLDMGIQIGPLKAGVSASADILESYDTINVRTGQVVNSGSSFASADVAGSVGDKNLKVGGSMNVTLDPAAESELSVKFSKSMGLKGKLTDDVSVGMKAP